MSETVNQETATENAEKTFTQAEVDAIVGDRLKRERGKWADYDELKSKAAKFDEMEEANKTELQKAIEARDTLQAELDGIKAENAIRDIRAAVANETGVPAHLLTATTEDECREQAKSILEYASPKGYPTIRDAGEVSKLGKPTTRQQFAEWAEQAFGN